jgi:hypothetical protein
VNIIKAIDKHGGRFLRWAANFFTGNSFIRVEQRVDKRIQDMEDKVLPALDGINRLRDDLERHTLEIYKRANEK